MSSPDAAGCGFEPRILGLLCHHCAYAGADRAGAAGRAVPASLRVVRVMCSGQVDPQLVLAAFAGGADGVLVLACHPGDCHYQEGNYRTAERLAVLGELVAALGIAPERLRLDFVSSSQGDRYVAIVEEMVATLAALGPLAAAASGRASDVAPLREGAEADAAAPEGTAPT